MSVTTASRRSSDTVSGRWRLDPRRSSVEFRVGHVWGLSTVRGHFERYRGRLDVGASPAIELTIDAASARTGNERRDRHLRSADFFDAGKHPHVRFVSDAVGLDGDRLEVSGRLSAAGHSIPLELDAHVRQVGGELEIEAAATAPHRELGMTFSPLRMISARTELSVKGHLIRDSDAAG